MANKQPRPMRPAVVDPIPEDLEPKAVDEVENDFADEEAKEDAEFDKAITEAMRSVGNYTESPKPAKKASNKPLHEEWQCQIGAKGQYEKLKKLRSNIPMEEHQAEILNDGVLYGNNSYALMYFLQE